MPTCFFNAVEGSFIIKTFITLFITKLIISLSFISSSSTLVTESNSIVFSEQSDLKSDDPSTSGEETTDSGDNTDASNESTAPIGSSAKTPVNTINDSESDHVDSNNDADDSESTNFDAENNVDDSGKNTDHENADIQENKSDSEYNDNDDFLFSEEQADLIESSAIISENSSIIDKSILLDDYNSSVETQAAESSSTKIALYYLNTQNLSWNNIDYKLCYYVGKGSVNGNIGTKGAVNSSFLRDVPEYNGEIGKIDISWDYYDSYNGYYRIYGTVTPYPNTKEEKTAYYYLNTRKIKYKEIDYRKCYYVGKGSVIEESDYRDIAQNVTVSNIPEYHDQVGRYSISWDYIAISDGSYRVYGTVTPEPDIETEKQALFYLNIKGYNLETIDFKKCYYVGRGSVIQVENYLGEIIDVKLTNIPKYDGSLGAYNIKWEKKELTSKDYYQIFATVVKKELVFDNIESLQQFSYLEVGDVVKTKGFYSPDDGGGAEYTITDMNPYGNDFRALKLANGLFAVLTINNNAIIANQFGAYGDGIHDDVKPIQTIIDLGYNVKLNKGQTYKFISNGLHLSNRISIIGNDATILVDDSYNPAKQDFQYYLIRNKYGNRLKNIDIRYLNIKVAFSNNRISGREFIVISPLHIDNITLKNVNVETSKTNNCIVCVWVDNGCNSLKISHCNFINQTSGATGGSLWLTTKESTPYSIDELRNCEISDTYVFSSAGDEALGIWGAHNINATFTDSTIEGKMAAPGTTRVVSVVSTGNNKSSKNVTFSNCEIKAACNKESQNSYYDSVFGIGADYPSSLLNITINNCQINSSIHSPIIFPSCFKPENISQYDAQKRNISISFTGCEINCSSTITGTTPAYYDTSVVYPTYAWDCQFSNCNIKCITAFAFLYVSDNAQYYIPKIKISDCNIEIKKANAFICQAEKSAGIDLEISKTEIIATSVDDIINSRLSRARTLTTQKNAANQLELSNVSINGNILK